MDGILALNRFLGICLDDLKPFACRIHGEFGIEDAIWMMNWPLGVMLAVGKPPPAQSELGKRFHLTSEIPNIF